MDDSPRIFSYIGGVYYRQGRREPIGTQGLTSLLSKAWDIYLFFKEAYSPIDTHASLMEPSICYPLIDQSKMCKLAQSVVDKIVLMLS